MLFLFFNLDKPFTLYELYDAYDFSQAWIKPCLLMRKSGMTGTHDFSYLISSVYSSSCACLNLTASFH